jgi:hypothetical protein
MTRLNLNETCLLEASGELDAAARERLHAYFVKHPSARTQFEKIQHELNLLRSLPRPQFSEAQQREYAAGIKQGIHTRLADDQRELLAAKRRKLVYTALATISAAAAAVVVVAGVLMVDQSITQSRQQQKIANINNIVDRISTYQDQPNQYDETLRGVAASIHDLQTGNASVAGIQDSEMTNLLDALSTLPGKQDAAPAPVPGS